MKKKGLVFLFLFLLLGLTACQNEGASVPALSSAHISPDSAASQAERGSSLSSLPAFSSSQVGSEVEPSSVLSPSSDGPVSSLSEEEMVKAIVKRGSAGLVMHFDYSIAESEDPETIYGSQARQEGGYAIFPDWHLAFQYTHGSVVGEIRDFNPDLQVVHRKEVEAYLGRPDYQAETAGGEAVLGYLLGEDYRIKFVFVDGSQNAALHHYNLFSPEAYRNSMGGNEPKLW